MAVSLYQLAEELGVSPSELQRWLKSKGLGAKKKTLTRRAADEARAHFDQRESHPLASALDQRAGLGEVARHDELTLDHGVRVKARPKLKWERVERSEVDVTNLDMKQQRDFFKQLRAGGASPHSQAGSTKPDHPQSASSTSSVTSEKRATTQAPTQRSQPQRSQPQRSKPLRRKPQANADHAVFGALAPLAGSLESMHDRPQPRQARDPAAEAEAARRFREGAKPLKHRSRDASDPGGARRGDAQESGRAASGQRSKPTASQRDEQSFQALFERPAQQSLEDRLSSARLLLKEVMRERDALRAELARRDRLDASETSVGSLEQSTRAPRELEEQSEGVGSLIWDQLHARGLDARQAVEALTQLLHHPTRGPELIYSLKRDQEAPIDRGFVIACDDVACQDVAHDRASLGVIPITDRHLCAVCQGSESRGWYHRLLIAARELGHEHILVVGGDDAHYAQLRELERQHLGVSWDFIAGGARINQTVANAKVGHKAAVILWGGLHLPHALSNIIKSAADRAGTPCFAIEPGARSVATLCRELLRSWGVNYDA